MTVEAGACEHPDVAAELAVLGMRLASDVEAGWYVLVSIAGETRKVWATDCD